MKLAEILMVYEGLPVLSMIAGALEFQGHRVTVANNTSSSAAELDRKTYDLIILKLSKGPEATTVLNIIKPRTKLIILSEEQKLPVEAYRVEVEDYIFLPAAPRKSGSALLNRCKDWNSGRFRERQQITCIRSTGGFITN